MQLWNVHFVGDWDNDIHIKQIMCRLCVSNRKKSVLKVLKKKEPNNKNMSHVNNKSKSKIAAQWIL